MPTTRTARSTPADPDFGDCLEISTSRNPQPLRYMGETPILPGCYLEVRARVKLDGGPFPRVRIAAYAGDAGGNPVTGIPLSAAEVALQEYGRVYEVRAIIGSGARTGVDMVWGTGPVFAHVGLDITGSPGAIVRVEDLRVEDRTSVFHRTMLDLVDVVDFGAIGDGVTDAADAFETADAAAQGRVLIVPKGTFYLSRDITLLSPVRFEGTVVMPDKRRLVLRENFDLPSYAEAFGDETLGLKKGLQSLLNFTDHESFDLGGRRVNLTGPIDVAAVTGNVSYLGKRRVLRNGALVAEDTPAWNPDVVTATASYDPADPYTLSGLANAGEIKVGALVEGFGVGREVYVRAVDAQMGTLTLSQPLARATAQQSYTFTRFKYMLDFSGFNAIRSFILEAVEFVGEARGCGVMLPPDGLWWTIRECWFMDTGLRAITSFGTACQGITVEQCEFFASDGNLDIPDRRSVALNVNNNDAKIRNNRCINFRHFAVLAGGGNLIIGNHFWQSDPQAAGEKTAGLVMTRPAPKNTITGNYIDTHYIELTNEHTADPMNATGVQFGRLTLVGNIFTVSKVQSWFAYLVIQPIGQDQVIEGLNVIGNVFKNIGVQTTRVESVDTSYGTIDHTRTRELVWEGNAYDRIDIHTRSPVFYAFGSDAAEERWVTRALDELPFGGLAMGVDSIQPQGPVRTAGGDIHYGMPYAEPRQANLENRVGVRWGTAVKGTVQIRVRSDIPL